jgi:NAD(P)-dependent dehydrogenase (short-subunit alcohol dehydrogenase family)
MAPSTSRVVLVVGASSGIGRALAHELSRRGARLVLASRGERPLEEAVTECRRLGAQSARSAVVDVRDSGAVAGLVREVAAEHGRVDAVVNCAAVLAVGRFEDVPPDVFDGVVETNLLGAANVARGALPVLREQGEGVLVLVGSVLGETAVPSMTPYVISKWGVRSLARQLALENRDVPGVRISLVAPAAVDTPIYRRAANFQGTEPRAPGPTASPEQVARTIADDLESPKALVTVGPFKRVMRWGFRLAPFAYDAVVGPLYRLLGTSGRAAPRTEGNVQHAVEELEGLHGEDADQAPAATRTAARR